MSRKDPESNRFSRRRVIGGATALLLAAGGVVVANELKSPEPAPRKTPVNRTTNIEDQYPGIIIERPKVPLGPVTPNRNIDQNNSSK